ncbi:anaerobic sulfite reductase subunit AsrB [Paraclostridium sordellii]|uniref:Anaerobic sulfite reductase subunit B n=1 Tax=Paraclostridium sordellii TaxID=1505 RepID=A0A0C7PDB1_PARSO|nr:anaerobic sulfite reductase subunit AsrB [Paeniclostridium sordellii]CEN21469.1 anaerobic sulfite reductase subunit B [[Clostridium] sordellii] [Paeniclostridium sordellii]CEN79217.1 anaerobic sulfite reductase subunit B [[Clostridium] sordellii] [Paeniclostridium sordellii]CEP88291.1 anaerobic sulfite reductase subunit B [[Clostridium] sordellii] [Paeniclostridium sordellii]CEP97052.1 anaerobic sulfite reductase subunit B [[Clostridium] sordellii] [Paeniclostridium sordellii]CEQ00740.1 ana
MNPYIPVGAEILEIIKHTEIEWTFRTKCNSKGVLPGQFYEISIPKYGESPISVSGTGKDYIDFTIRKVGKVTDEIFSYKVGDKFFLRGPYGNGFDISLYEAREIVVVAGGSGLAPVRGIMDYYYDNFEKCKSCKLIVGFKSPKDILFKDDLKRWSEKLDVIVTVDGAEEGYEGHIGLVTKYIPSLEIKNIDNVSAIVVGPPMMMKFTVGEFLKRDLDEKNIWVSYERKMCCGVGKCGHCKMDDTYICIDGPVFNYFEAKKLID